MQITRLYRNRTDRASRGRNSTDPDDLPAEESQFKRILGGVINGFVMDKRFVRKKGKILNARISMQCMEKEDKSIDCILALVQDMADRKSKEEKVPV